MNRDFFAVMLNKKPELLRAILAFNGLFALPSLPDVLAALPNSEILWNRSAVRRRFGASCVPNPNFWDFEDERFRLALVDTKTLERLALTFGVAVIAPEIAHLLRRDEVRDAQERLGDRLYTYALHRARFQVNPDVLPEVFFLLDDAPVDIRAYGVGVRSLLALTSRLPESLRECFVFQGSLSGASSAGVSQTAASDLASDLAPDLTFDPDQEKRLWVAVKKVLLKEVAPLWAPCFD